MHVELEATMETISSFCDAARFLQHFRISAKNGDNVQRSLHVLAEKVETIVLIFILTCLPTNSSSFSFALP